ncbi:hypothetical protein QF035_008937 [Streptomyces umbrinus]|uniref:Uncharacterized protein n=1 Tax=Streptomyces umbrinus TaxID=67370 RepID=A0ABU0T6B8_9ACTN|nr:hypothetical protein [Streptomyces umbrinus]MDQ1031355.1 hypothetical protein [Streptomyces umbrinus]
MCTPEVFTTTYEPDGPPSDRHMAVYLDDTGELWSDYPTMPAGDHVLPLVWAAGQTVSRQDLADRGVTLRRIGWCK